MINDAALPTHNRTHIKAHNIQLTINQLGCFNKYFFLYWGGFISNKNSSIMDLNTKPFTPSVSLSVFLPHKHPACGYVFTVCICAKRVVEGVVVFSSFVLSSSALFLSFLFFVKKRRTRNISSYKY